jgi:hypothetical protein
MKDQRFPRTYRGLHHETLGSDILAVLGTVHAPEEILGPAWHGQLLALAPDDWYPIRTQLDLLAHLEQRSGRAALLKMGRQLYRDTHEQRLQATARCAGDVVFGIDSMYHHANRGTDIGGWCVLRFGPGVAVLEKTTPHRCALEEGILLEALHLVGTEALIVHTQCFHAGADSCLLELHSTIKDQRWSGPYAPLPAGTTGRVEPVQKPLT